MARNATSAPGRFLRNVSTIVGGYRAKDIKDLLEKLDPKDHIEFIYKFTKLLIDHPDLLKTEGQKQKDNEVIISFFDIGA